MKEKILKSRVFIWVVATLVLMGMSYYSGFSKGKVSAQSDQTGTSQYGNRTGQARRMGGGGVNGEVLSKDATSITVKMRDGSSRIVLYSESTQVLKSDAGVIDNVTVGSQVMVQGASNQDGSVTAQVISIRPKMMQTDKPAQQ